MKVTRKSTGGSGGASLTVLDKVRYVDKAGSDTNTGGPADPFLTIGKAITDLGLPVDAADERKIRTIIVNGGIYPENITVPSAGVWQFVANGHVTLGNGDGVNLTSSVPNNVTWTNNDATEFGQLRPTCVFTQAFGGIYSGSTHIAYGTTGWDISGNFTTAAAGIATSTELHLHGVKIQGVLDCSGDSGILNIHMEKCYFKNESSAINYPANLAYAKECEFYSLIDLGAGTLGHIERCEIVAGVTYTGGWTTAVRPEGFFACRISGTLTSGAGNYRADGTTQALNTPMLAGGNSLTDLA